MLHSLAIGAAVIARTPLRWEDLGLSPIALDLGVIAIKWYSLAYLAGIVLGYWQVSRMTRAPGSPMAQRHADDLFFYATLGIILGGRLGYAAFYTGGASGTPSIFTHFTPGQRVSWDLLRLWDGGMSFHGGLIGTVMAIGWVAWSNKLNFIRLCDYVSVVVPFGMLFGRLANFVNGELWGRIAGNSVPWAMVFPGGGPEPRHPSQLYEAGLEGLLLSVVLLAMFWKTRARWRVGLLTGVFLMGIGVGRFVVEFFREPDAQLQNFARATHLSMGQWLTIPLILTGLVLLVRAFATAEASSENRPEPA